MSEENIVLESQMKTLGKESDPKLDEEAEDNEEIIEIHKQEKKEL